MVAGREGRAGARRGRPGGLDRRASRARRLRSIPGEGARMDRWHRTQRGARLAPYAAATARAVELHGPGTARPAGTDDRDGEGTAPGGVAGVPLPRRPERGPARCVRVARGGRSDCGGGGRRDGLSSLDGAMEAEDGANQGEEGARGAHRRGAREAPRGGGAGRGRGGVDRSAAIVGVG